MRQQVFKDFDQLVGALSDYCVAPAPYVILVDGFTNAGKSFLAKRLSEALGAVHVELDEFLNNCQGTYVAHIRYPELIHRLADLNSESRNIVLEGVCAQAIVHRIELTITTSVYVKRLVANAWVDGRVLREARSLAEAMTTEEGKTQITSRLDEEVFAYHFRFRPNERSAFVYSWNA